MSELGQQSGRLAADRRFSAGGDADRRGGDHRRHRSRSDNRQFVLPRIPGLTREMSFEVIASAALMILYRLVIRRLGEYPRNDLRLTGSLRPLARWPRRRLRRFRAGRCDRRGARHLSSHRRRRSNRVTARAPRPRHFRRGLRRDVFRGILFRWLEEFGGSWARPAADLGLFRRRASCQSQRELGRRGRDRLRGWRDARRRLHADTQPVAADGHPRRLEFHPGRDFRHPGVGRERPRTVERA